VTVSATFNAKTIGLYAGEGDKDKNRIQLSEYQVAKGQNVKVTLTDKNSRITKITLKNGGTVVGSADNSNTITIPADTAENAKLTVVVETAEKTIEVKAGKMDHGSVIPGADRADPGETVELTIKPDAGYKLGSLKGLLKATDGSYTTEISVKRRNDPRRFSLSQAYGKVGRERLRRYADLRRHGQYGLHRQRRQHSIAVELHRWGWRRTLVIYTYNADKNGSKESKLARSTHLSGTMDVSVHSASDEFVASLLRQRHCLRLERGLFRVEALRSLSRHLPHP
jgi:hypothetical protein